MQRDLIERIEAQPAPRLYARGVLTGNRPSMTARVHARAMPSAPVCGASPYAGASRWEPAAGQVRCPRCVVLCAGTMTGPSASQGIYRHLNVFYR